MVSRRAQPGVETPTSCDGRCGNGRELPSGRGVERHRAERGKAERQDRRAEDGTAVGRRGGSQEMHQDGEGLPGGEEDHRQVGVRTDGDDQSIGGSGRPAAVGEQAQEEPGPRDRTPGEDDVAPGVLGEPDVVIGDGEQRGGEERLAPGGDLPAEDVEHRDRGRPEQNRRQTDAQGGLPEQDDRDPRQRRVERVMVVVAVRRENLPERQPERVHQRVDLVDPQAAVGRDQPQTRPTQVSRASAITACRDPAAESAWDLMRS